MDATKRNRRILVVDDNQAIHDDFKKILCPSVPASVGGIQAVEDILFGAQEQSQKFESFTLHSAFQGQEGFAAVQRACQEGKPYALAFVDVRMPPGWDGIQTTKEIWKIDSDIQIVICTAYSDYSWAEMMSQLGQSDRLVVLKKPFDNIEALQLAHALANKWELSQQVRRRVQELDRQVTEQTDQLRAVNEKLRGDIQLREQSELRLAAFAKLGNRLSAAQDAKAAALTIVEAADQLLGWDACLCSLYSAEEDRIDHLLKIDTVEGRRKQDDRHSGDHLPSALAQKAIREGGQLILRGDAQQTVPELQPFGDKSRPSASILYVPVRNGPTVIGVISIQSYKHKAYNLQSLETLQALADHCAGALNRIKFEDTLRRTEQQLRQAQKMEAVGQLAGGIAHDFNNILAIILGNAELTLENDPPIPETAAECQKQIIDSANRAAGLTRQLLAFGRKQVFQARPLNLNQHLTQLSILVKRIIGEDIELRCTYEENLPQIEADATMIDQVMMNLLANARDAMPTGGRVQIATEKIELTGPVGRSHPEARAGRFVCLRVTDTGVGIAAENLTHIFEPFFTTKDVGKGTGLGLATVFGVVKQHRGWVEVSSQVGTGTTFRVFLPALDQVESPAAPAEPKAEAPGGEEVILLVEDDAAVRQINRRMLQDAGYKPLEAASGHEALVVWAENYGRISLLLTDIIMPGGMNGCSLAEHLATAKPELKVLFMSGYSGDCLDARTTALLQNKYRLLKKPFTRAELLQSVRGQLDGNPGPDEQAAGKNN